MGQRTNKQKDALITTLLFFNIVFLILSFWVVNVYVFISINLFLCLVYKLMVKYETRLEAIFEVNNFTKKLNNQLK